MAAVQDMDQGRRPSLFKRFGGLLQKIKDRSRKKWKVTYAQAGEDLLLNCLLCDLLRIPLPSYLDIGAHHPTLLSNTCLLYQKGASGVCVEPDPTLWRKIKKVRKRDICLNIGVGTGNARQADFYILSSRTLNTFSKPDADALVSSGECRLEQVVPILLVPIDQIIEEHFDACPNFVSLDTEGFDLEILKSFNFSKYRPEVFCVETLTYPDEHKITETAEVMASQGYLLYADTYVNSIFVEEKAWNKRGLGEPLCLHLHRKKDKEAHAQFSC